MIIIGIAGGTGSGKTTVVKKIAESFSEEQVTVLSQDSYYNDSGHLSMEERKLLNFDHPDAIEFSLLEQHIKQLKLGFPIEEPQYSYLACTRSENTTTIQPRPVIIVEGIMMLYSKAIRDLLDIKVFVDCESDIRLSRVITRDVVERGRNTAESLRKYEATVRPSHIQFIEPTKQFADIIVPEGGNNVVAIDILTNFIRQIL
ncbi:MAG: uridine kinase [Mangrovibacterium sp.]